MAKKILLLFAHPSMNNSRVHSKLLPLAKGIEHLTIHDLYAQYPDEFIIAEREQMLLNNHDIILMQFPLFWFSTPGILKNWQDIVLEYGYAIGGEKQALKDKYFGVITSTGGRDYSATNEEGFRRLTVRDYLVPLESMAMVCAMKYLPPFVIHDGRRIDDEKLAQHARNYRYYLDNLSAIEKYYEDWKSATNINGVLFGAKGW